MRSRAARFIQLGVSLATLGLAVWIFFNHQFVIDRLAVWQYRPTPAIEALVDRARFAGDGEFYFYASQPRLSSREEFNQQCVNQEDHAVILGCYAVQRIYVYDVQDERLNGVREVTAAHEMLHAAYDRLSESERERVGALLEAEVATADPALLERLEVYNSLGQAERTNELHSIIATEVEDISDELEAYYARYFTDRHAVVALFHSYESVFRELQIQQEAIMAELNELVADINSRTAAYNQAITALDSEVEAFNRQADVPGGFSSQAEFDQARDALLAQQAALEQEYVAIEAQRARYEERVAALDALNVQRESLQQSLDSSPSPVPSV